MFQFVKLIPYQNRLNPFHDHIKIKDEAKAANKSSLEWQEN